MAPTGASLVKYSSFPHRPGSLGGLQCGCGQDLGHCQRKWALCAQLPSAPRPQNQQDLVSGAQQISGRRTEGSRGSLRRPQRRPWYPTPHNLGRTFLHFAKGMQERGRRWGRGCEPPASTPRPLSLPGLSLPCWVGGGCTSKLF